MQKGIQLKRGKISQNMQQHQSQAVVPVRCTTTVPVDVRQWGQN